MIRRRPASPAIRDLRLGQGGVSLIEVLLSLVLLGVGVLAVIALQLLAKSNNVDSLQQTIAAQLAYDMIERMRANNSGGALDTYYDNAPQRVGFLVEEPSPDCTGGGSACLPAQFALHDLWSWERQLSGAGEVIVDGVSETETGGLVNGRACIDGPIGGISGMYSVTITWRGGTTLPTDTSVACGAGAADASGRLYGDADEYRRTMTVQAYIAVR